MRSGHPRIGTIAVAAIAFASLAASPSPAAAVPPAADLLPDLVATPPTNPQLSVETLGDGQDHLLVRFDAAIHNAGQGPLEIRGSNPVDGVMTVTGQRIRDDGGGSRFDTSRHPVIRFEPADGHDHWHVDDAARYTLWNAAGTAEIGRGAKVGFCLEDVAQVDSSAPPAAYDSNATGYCNAGQPDASSVFEGITRGWQDVYDTTLPFQWVDLSDVAPGSYRLGEQIDPDNVFIESDKSNNGPAIASDVVTVPGWLASSATVRTTGPQSTILLGAQRFGGPPDPVFTIESAPQHGKLSQLSGFHVVYTPNPRFEGTDTFTFSVRDPSSRFPRHSPVGTVTVKVPGAPVHAFKRQRLLAKVRFTRKGRFLIVRGRAMKTGLLQIQISKGKRQLGTCTKQARVKHGFRCRIKLRRRASARGAHGRVSLLVSGQPTAFDTFRVPRRFRG